ncbi:unnamed protein product [Protopolystoma xenopodis]|uniref:Uncharacterized protein n=1 Tax=Protopolystoma xenopodis TaxID=117903 RepID=A0A448XCQ6_9PLAT|nr:unnamed protein product [Protopolystoma xenopodis]
MRARINKSFRSGKGAKLFNAMPVDSEIKITEASTFGSTEIPGPWTSGAAHEAGEEDTSFARKRIHGAMLLCRANFAMLDPGSRPLFNEYLEMSSCRLHGYSPIPLKSILY